jgi:hypothetical protein
MEDALKQKNGGDVVVVKKKFLARIRNRIYTSE